MRYEQGMSITFDIISKSVMISFRDREHTLPGPYLNQKEAVQAAEKFCLEHGWIDPRPRA